MSGRKLFPHQKANAGFFFNLGAGENAVDLSETGTGKTATALATAHMDGAKRILYVVPSSVATNAQDEMRGMGFEADIIRAKKDIAKSTSPCWIVTYQSINFSLRPFLQNKSDEWDMVIFDEAHKLGNKDAKSTRHWLDYVKTLKRSCRALGLTATLQNRDPMNAVSVWRVLRLPGADKLYHNTLWVEKRFSRGQTGYVCEDWKDGRLAEEIIFSRAVRSTKKEVLKDVPPVQRRVYRVPVSAAALKKRALSLIKPADRDDLGAWMRANSAAEYIETGELDDEAPGVLQAVLHACAMEKAPAVADYAALLAESEQVCVWGFNLAPLEKVAAMLDEAGVTNVLVTGEVKGKARDRAIESFRNGEAQVFIGTPKTAGAGINLQNASRVIHLSVYWDPADAVQAENRCHRHGQTKQVVIETALADGSDAVHRIEAAVLKNNRRKQKSAAKAGLDGSLGTAVSAYA